MKLKTDLFDTDQGADVNSLAIALARAIDGIADKKAKILALNNARLELHRISPMRAEPVDCVLWVEAKEVYANDYNPNSVAPPEMELLRTSILNDGYTQPIVTFEEEKGRQVVDGFHRNRVGKECKEVSKRVNGCLPVVSINEAKSGKEDRIASTIRHNRARGKHQVGMMSEIVMDLKRRNWSPKKIAKELGMDPDEILRLGQIGGLAEMFEDWEFSNAWEASATQKEEATNDS